MREPLAAVSGLTEPEEVDFTVRAYDAAGNVSEPSAPVRWLTWRFDMPGYLEGWQMANQVVSPQVAGGSLQFDIGGNDSYVISPQLRADTSRYRYLRIRMRNSTTATLGQVFFSTEAEPGYSEERTATFSLFANDALFTDYLVELGANPRWTGTATQIRLDPVANASSGRILIAEVQLQPWPGPDAVPPAGPVLINGGAPYTNSPAVTLTLTASDASGVAASQFSHNGVSWTAWEPFAPSRSWNLVNLDGTRQVFARFRDPYGNVSPAVSASIVLDRVAPPTPSQPSGTSPFTNSPEVTFTWSTVADALSGTAGYICRVGTTPGGTDVFNGYVGNTLRKSIAGESGRTYYCRVKAVDNAGNIGGLSAVSAGVLVDTEPPAPPSVPADAGGIHHFPIGAPAVERACRSGRKRHSGLRSAGGLSAGCRRRLLRRCGKQRVLVHSRGSGPDLLRTRAGARQGRQHGPVVAIERRRRCGGDRRTHSRISQTAARRGACPAGGSRR